MQNVGNLTKYLAQSYALSGPVARSCGLKHDIRLLYPYEIIKYFPINVVVGTQGDNLTRFFLRFEEMLICLQYLEFLLYTYLNQQIKFNNSWMVSQKLESGNIESIKTTMESTIYDFKSYSEGYNISENKSYTKIESPRGEFGVTLLS